MSDKPLDCVGFDLASSQTGKHDFRASESETTANWQNSVHARRDDLTSFVKWVKANPEIDDSIKQLVSGLATSYNRERSR